MTNGAMDKMVLTASKAEEDITKPVDFDQFTKVVKSIEDFWFTIVKFPKSEGTDV